MQLSKMFYGWCFGKERVISFNVDYRFKTEADMTLGIHTIKIKVDSDSAIKLGYVRSGDWKYFKVIDIIINYHKEEYNQKALKLLAEVRRGTKFNKNACGAWVQGKHVVAVFWDISDLEWEQLTYEEYLEWKSTKKIK